MKSRYLISPMLGFLYIAGLVGCAALREPFPEATGPSAATLSISRASPHSMQVYGFKDSTTCLTPMNFGGTQLMAAGEKRVVKLEPDKEVAIAFHSYLVTSYCDLIVSFRPKAHRAYLATLDADDMVCSVRLTVLEGVSQLPEPTFRKRVFTRPLTESGSFCGR